MHCANVATPRGRYAAFRSPAKASAIIAASVTLSAALVIGALPSTAQADSVGSLQAKANLISEELVQAQLEVDGYQQQYSVASARVEADEQAIAATQAQIASDRHKIAAKYPCRASSLL